MIKGLTEIVFIMDRSGSMAGLESDTIGGFNAMLHKQQKQEGRALLSLVLFDDQIETIYDRIDIQEVPNLDDESYYVRGCTAFLDAMGTTIEYIQKKHQALKDECPEKTIFIITTDGLENASRHYRKKKIKKMIDKQIKQHQWQFIYLGANMDAIEEASHFGIGHAFNFIADSEGTSNNFDAIEKTLSTYRMMEDLSLADESIECAMAQVNLDYTSRGH